MHVLFLAQHFAPEEVSGAVLASELAADLHHRGHQVTFVTSAPSYPHGKVFSGYHNRLLFFENMDGVRVVRTWSYISPMKTFWRRMFNYGSFSASAFYGGLIAGRPDVIFSYSPPLPLGLSAYLLKQIWGVPWILRVEDLYPDAAVAAGIVRNRTLIRLFFALERFLYWRADHISLISEGFREQVLRKGVPAEKLSVHPVWADPEVVRPLPCENGFRRSLGLEEKFILLYAGNLGYNSFLEDVLAAAEILREDRRIYWVIVGEGVKKAGLQEMAVQKKLENVTFLPYQPREVFVEMLSAANVGLVTLNPELCSASLPSKIFNIMSCARPVLAVTPERSEVADLVCRAGCGVNVSPGNPQRLAGVVREFLFKRDWLEIMGSRGRQFVKSYYSRQTCLDQYESLLKQITGNGRLP